MNARQCCAASLVAILFGLVATAHAAQDPQAGPTEGSQADHPLLRIGNESVRVDFRARFQVDARSPKTPGDDDARALDLARKRVGVHGAVGTVVAFQVEAELEANDPWRDVYVDYRQFDVFRVQAGQFKLPFSLDENTSATDLDFIYRSGAATWLSPGRDRGVMLHGRVWRRVLKYEAGVFSTDGDHTRRRTDTAAHSSHTTAMRVTTAPFSRSESVLASLRAAVAVTTGDLDEGISGVRGRTALGTHFFPAGFWVKGSRRRTGVELEWHPRPFTIAAEYIRVADERRDQGVAGGDLPPLVGSGWYVSGTSRIVKGKFGRVELAARAEGLRFGSDGPRDVASASPRADRIASERDRTATLGVNWYVNRWIKLQGNLIHETVDTSRELVPQPRSPWGRVVRLQLAL